jgi:hypothetical protein
LIKPYSRPARNAALDRARTALTVLVVIHHAVIPYTVYGHADRKTWLGFDGVVLATDSFFMAMFFLLSGLFVWPSLRRKTLSTFLRDRLLRLGVPFAIAAVTLMPLAYYTFEPPGTGFAAYWWKTITKGPWQSGPVWFIWVLLLLDALAAVLYRLAPHCLAPINRLSRQARSKPMLFFAVFLGITTLAYLPLRLYYGVTYWFRLGGPLVIQASRTLLYASSFVVGAGIGLADIGKGLLARDGHLAGQWRGWLLAALVTYLCLAGLALDECGVAPTFYRARTSCDVTYGVAFPLFSAAMTFAILAWFLHFDRPGSGLLDAMHEAAYGIFLVHYVPLLWMQYWLSDTDLPAVVKAAITFTFALTTSWAVTAMLLRIPGARRVL